MYHQLILLQTIACIILSSSFVQVRCQILEIYTHYVIVMEKIHGSNIQFTFTWIGTTWDYLDWFFALMGKQ